MLAVSAIGSLLIDAAKVVLKKNTPERINSIIARRKEVPILEAMEIFIK